MAIQRLRASVPWKATKPLRSELLAYRVSPGKPNYGPMTQPIVITRAGRVAAPRSKEAKVIVQSTRRLIETITLDHDFNN